MKYEEKIEKLIKLKSKEVEEFHPILRNYLTT